MGTEGQKYFTPGIIPTEIGYTYETTVDPSFKEDLQPPKMYNVFILNDDFTDAFFVVHILKVHFGKSTQDAFAIMESAHGSDRALVGKYPKDIAETKAAAANDEAKSREFPLQVVAEKGD